tara:strand:+ start:11 stop:4570 length:4560 start_codon:yes stop_codon:yes gene_type:complete
MAKQEYKILEFHGGTNNKFDPRDIADNQNQLSRLSIRRPGRLVTEGNAKSLYSKTNLNGHTITNITGTAGGFEQGYGLHTFSHDFNMVRADIIQDGDDVDIDDTNWSRNRAGATDAGWSDASPAAFDDNNGTASLINILGGNAIDAGKEYQLWFDVGVATLNLRIGGGDLSGSSNLPQDFYTDSFQDYEVGTHSITFTAPYDRSHLWFVAHNDSGGAGTIDNVSCYPTSEVASERMTDLIVLNDKNEIDIYDLDTTSWYTKKFTLGSREETVKPEYYNVDGALRVCDTNFDAKNTTYELNMDVAPLLKDQVNLVTSTGTIAAGSLIQINNEIMYVTSGSSSSTNITVIRGFANTKATTHANGSLIWYVNVPKYFGHIKKDRFFEAKTSLSINEWVEDVQTPQPPNNSRKGLPGYLASSSEPNYTSQSVGMQSLRVSNEIAAHNQGYPFEGEKVHLEFSDTNRTVGIKRVELVGNGTNDVKIHTTQPHGFAVTDKIQLSNMHNGVVADNESLGVYEGEQTVKGATATTFTFDFEATPDQSLDGSGSAYSSGDVGYTDISGDATSSIPGALEIELTTALIPFLDSVDPDGSAVAYNQYAGTAYIEITGQTGVPGLNGIHRAYRRDHDQKLYIKHGDHSKASSASTAATITQLIGLCSRDADAALISGDLKGKWNFAMSFTYDGPGQEVQESLLTMGYKMTLVENSTDNSSNAVDNFSSDIMQNGTSPGASGWTERDTDGGTDGFSTFANDASPIVFDKSEAQDSSAINTLSTAIVSGKRYQVTFAVGTASLNIAIGGGDLTGNTMDNVFVAAADYAASGSHTVYFQATAAATHLWFTVDSSASAGDGTLDSFYCYESGYGDAATSIVVDNGPDFSPGDIILIDDINVSGTDKLNPYHEQLRVHDVDGNTLKIGVNDENVRGRGYNNTTARLFGNNSKIYKLEEFSPDAAVDWTGNVASPECIIRFRYKHGDTQSQWNPRINGFKIYMRNVTDEDSSSDWLLFSSVNFDKGTYQMFAASEDELILDERADVSNHSYWSTGTSTSTDIKGTTIKEKPIYTYVSENRFTPETIIDASFNVSALAGRKVYIGNIRQGGRSYPDRMIKSPVNKFDIFPETNYLDVAVGDGDEITALESFGDRLLQFKKDKLYILNISGEFDVLESEHPNTGVNKPHQVVKTSNGIAWINDIGLWFFDGKGVECLTRHLQSNGFTIGTTSLIGYDERSNRIIFTPEAKSSGDSLWFLYDLELKAYQSYYWGNLFPTVSTGSGIHFYSNFINIHRDMVFAYVTATDNTEVNFYKWSNTSDGEGDPGLSQDIYPLWKSKDFDFGSPSVNKKIYKIYVTYKSTGHSGVKMLYGTNGSETTSSTFSNSTYYDTAAGKGFLNTSGEWQVAELKPSASINNVKSIQLVLSTNPVGITSPGTAACISGNTVSARLHGDLGSTDYGNYILSIYDGPGRYNVRRIQAGSGDGTEYITGSQVASFATLEDHGYGNSITSSSLYLLGAVAPDFEINDITIIFRPKRVK